MSTGGILSGPAIREAVRLGEIEIDPFVPEHLNPASYDVTLGEGVLEYVTRYLLDSSKKNPTVELKIEEEGLVVHPGRLYLMHTRERIFTRGFVPVLDGKSSLGRLGLMIHVTAGYGDPGFDGQYTLEVTSVAYPVRIFAGMRIGQMRFHMLFGEQQQYAGNYTGETALGPVASRSWKQFEERQNR